MGTGLRWVSAAAISMGCGSQPAAALPASDPPSSPELAPNPAPPAANAPAEAPPPTAAPPPASTAGSDGSAAPTASSAAPAGSFMIGRLEPGDPPRGRLEPAVIQKAVREHYGNFRKCYEAGLGRNRDLKGRVSARFVIERNGTVSNVSNGGSDLPDPEVISCVLQHFYGIRFPEPEGGIITVVYPIMLEPG